MIVVDASAVVLALFRDGDARELIASDDVHAPHLIDSEVTQVLRSHERTMRVSPSVARKALDVWLSLGIRRYGATAVLDRVWSLRHNLTAYDATYVALAEALGCSLLSADRRLASAPGIQCPVVVVRS